MPRYFLSKNRNISRFLPIKQQRMMPKYSYLCFALNLRRLCFLFQSDVNIKLPKNVSYDVSNLYVVLFRGTARLGSFQIDALAVQSI
jgi:hypothetical protein